MDDDKMAPVREALERLRQEESYEENVVKIALHEEPRRSRSPKFLARLLYMLADRPISVIQMQLLTGLHEGHLYRFLERGGVIYKAATVRKLEVEKDGRPWRGTMYIDPLSGLMVKAGLTTAPDLEIVPSEDRRKLFVNLPMETEEEESCVPLPIWPARLRK